MPKPRGVLHCFCVLNLEGLHWSFFHRLSPMKAMRPVAGAGYGTLIADGAELPLCFYPFLVFRGDLHADRSTRVNRHFLQWASLTGRQAPNKWPRMEKVKVNRVKGYWPPYGGSSFPSLLD